VGLVLEALWVGRQRRARGLKRQEVGGRFVSLSPTLRARIGAILRFDDARPALELVAIEASVGRRRKPRT
jgi:hypothetical protein